MTSPDYNFWHKLQKPFFVMAPLADVTDAAFRHIIAKYGKPDVMYTEFTSADGLVHPKGREKLLVNLKYGEEERPIVAQLFSGRPDKMREAAKLVRDLGFDGLDINMGCPDKTIEKQGAGAALIKNPSLAQELVAAAEEGFGAPVAVKTRIGYSKIEEFEPWIRALVAARPVAITVHLRTRKEMSKVPAHWELAKQYSNILKNVGILVIGNGDVVSIADAKEKAQENNLDGVMLGRAIFGNPYLFANKQSERSKSAPTATPPSDRIRIMVEHTHLFEKLYLKNPSTPDGRSGSLKSFSVMKKFFKAYIAGHPHAKDFQEKLMASRNAQEVEKISSYYQNLA